MDDCTRGGTASGLATAREDGALRFGLAWRILELVMVRIIARERVLAKAGEPRLGYRQRATGGR